MNRPRALLRSIPLLLLVFSIAACVPPGPPGPANSNANSNTSSADSSAKPSLEVSPAKKQSDWMIADADTVTVTATAPGADSVSLLYRPTSADEEDYVRLKNGLKAADAATGKFATELKLPNDFAGDVWVEAAYKDGRKTESDKLALRRSSQDPDATSSEPAGGASPSPDISARSDKLTGGTIQKAEIVKGGPDVRITINIPAFQLTLWQGDKEVKTYAIAVGRKEFPLPAGHRVAREIVLNPDWVPPDSDWVRKEKVEPGEPIESGNPKNPLGDVKIPLGDAILIHEAKPSDLGKLVSHGCARLVEKDLVDLVEKIAAAQGLPITPDELKKTIATDERKNIGLKKPVPVDISYDTAVIEGGKLHLYPDVYDQKTDLAGEVRTALAEAGVTGERLDDATIKGMVERVDRTKTFVVAIDDVKAGKALAAGKSEPIVGKGSGAEEKAKPKRS